MSAKQITYQLYILLFLILQACGGEPTEELPNQTASIPAKIDYNFHVKPILSDRCFACHGPDAQKREAELRLDIEEEAYAALKNGAGHAIVPGNVRKSQLVHRIMSDDPDFMMPPPESNLYLNEREKNILVRWIRQKAVYKPHWAFTKPEKPNLPKSRSKWVKNEVDRFILKKMQQSGVEPAPEAEKEQLIRRLYFDLTGLPPSLEDLDRWMDDNNPEYYANLVDHLLSKPAYGERMAAHWLDVARFADSEGYLDDFHHTFWPYRGLGN